MAARQTNQMESAPEPATESTPPLLRLHLFGGFRVTRDSGTAPAERWPRPGARALVKLLAVTSGHSLHREQAMEICWPDADPQAATGSLRVALHAARHALEPELAPRAPSSYLKADNGLLFLDPATVWIDADHAETAALAALADGDVRKLADANARFTGELLPEDRYASWAEDRRIHLAGLREQLLLRLAAAHLDRGVAAEAAAVAEEALALSPAEELAHRILIDACLRQGLRRRAVRQYHVCRKVLDAELGVRPGPETERLHLEALAVRSAPVRVTTTLPSPLRVRADGPLHGRADVLERLSASEGPPVILLTGEAGIGKTRLVREAARSAAASGAAVLWGGAQDAGDHTPYGAFAEALDSWAAELDAAERARVGAEYPELAAFLPSLGQVGSAGDRSPEQERDRLFGASASLLGDLAAVRPVLVVLDDLHAADEGSYQLLSHLARKAEDRATPLRFLVTYREEELPGNDARRISLTRMLRQRLAVREELGRLDKESCLAVARDAAADAPGARVWELSLGNPLFTLELAHSLPKQAGAQAPQGVRDLVAERLGRLDADTRRVVEALSASGGEAALSELLDVAEHGLRPPVEGATAADAIEHAIAASFVEEREVVVAGRPEAGLAFRHPLIRLTCYEQLSTVRRRQLHAAFAQAVERRRPEAVDTLASHFARADDPRAAEYLRRAAERAAALYANDTADRYYRDLVVRLDVDTARARLAHSQVLRRMGDFERAAEVLRLALAEFVRRGDHDDSVLAAAHLAETLVRTGAMDAADEVLGAHPVGPDTAPEPVASHFLARTVLRGIQGRHEDAYAATHEALAAAQEVPGITGQGLLARGYALQATTLGLTGRLGEAREAGDRALAPAQAFGDPTLLASVLSTVRENARRHGRLEDAVRFGERSLEHAEQSGDPIGAAFERANLAELRLLLEEIDAARELAETAVSGADRDGAWCLPYALASLARVRLRTGDPRAAAALLDRAEATAARSGDQQARHEASRARAELFLRTGRPTDALRVLGGVSVNAPDLVAWGELLSGRPGAACRIAATEAERAAGTGERLAEVEARVVQGAALLRSGEPGAARRALARAEALAEALPYPAGVQRVAQTRQMFGQGEGLGPTA
ncbi:AAA family ATPase [Streptomyces flaveolus]|uniref:ATP-binding protein n=1 Tax=Streptomyces flaveolus TaxID=67297 RepID=UPI00331B85B1